MPLIYGEEDNAFIRLKEEIIKRSGEKVTASPSPSSTVPFRRDGLITMLAIIGEFFETSYPTYEAGELRKSEFSVLPFFFLPPLSTPLLPH